jgi:hypothetical protein
VLKPRQKGSLGLEKVRASDVTGLVRLLVGWLESALKSQPVRSFDWLAAGWFQSYLINRVTS